MGEYSKLKKSMSNENSMAMENINPTTAGIPNSALIDVLSGNKAPTSEMMGHRQNLAQSIQTKMSKAFGMDFSNLQLYQSDMMSETDTKGMASGNKVVLSSDINLNTLEGQAILGHELSHIHAQSQGEGLGNSGLYHNEALEQRADAEGMMAARGMNIFGETSSMSEAPGMVSFDSLTPIGGGMSATAGSPMQAKSDKGGGSKIGNFFKNLFGFGKKTEAPKSISDSDSSRSVLLSWFDDDLVHSEEFED